MFQNIDSVTVTKAENGFIVEWSTEESASLAENRYDGERANHLAVFTAWHDLVAWLQDHFTKKA